MSDYRIAGRRAIVTGGARGIGLAVARRLIGEGVALALMDIDAAALQDAAAELEPSGTVVAVAVDQTDLDAVERGVAEVADKLGGVDILVNNAGIAGDTGPLWDYDPALFRRIVDINLMGVFYCCRAVVPLLRQRGWGRIVNVASIAGKEGNPNASAYSASKAGVIALTKSLGKELATENIVVNCVTPAAVETEILQQMPKSFVDYMLSRIPLARLGQPDEVAALITFLCSEEVSFSTGAVFDVSGGRATY